MLNVLLLKVMLCAAPAAAPVAAGAPVASSVADPKAPVSYQGLSIEALLEQKRLLREEQPEIVVPIIIAALGLPPVGFGAVALGMALYQTSGYHTSSLPDPGPLFVTGSILLVVGAAIVTVGLVWLSKALTIRAPIGARLEEIESLIGLRMKAAPPPAAPGQPGAPPPLSMVPSSSGLAVAF